MNKPNTNTGHGHVWARPDGIKVRCGGPGICAECARDAAMSKPVQQDAPTDERTFAEWLNARRDLRVAEVFHEIVARYAPAQDAEQARDAERLDALEATAGENAWIVAKNKDNFTVYLRPAHHATRKTIREAIDAARALKSTSAGRGE